MKKIRIVLLTTLAFCFFSVTAFADVISTHNSWIQLPGAQVKAFDSASNTAIVNVTAGEVSSYSYGVVVYVKNANGFVVDSASSNTVGKHVEAWYVNNTGAINNFHSHEAITRITAK